MDKQRELFETWAKDFGYKFDRFGSTSAYSSDATNKAWSAWQAALAQSQQAAGELPVVKTWQERMPAIVTDWPIEKNLALEAENADLRAALRAYGQRAAVASELKPELVTEGPAGWRNLMNNPERLSGGAVGYVMVHPTGGDTGFAWKHDDERFKGWIALPLVYAAGIGVAPSQPQQEAVPAEASERDCIDAQRYRFLRNCEKDITADNGIPWCVKLIREHGIPTSVAVKGSMLDVSIDAAIAMSAAKEPGNE